MDKKSTFTEQLNLALIITASLVIILVSFFIQIGVDPHYEGMSTDSGVFAYCGNQILTGHLLYRDCLDNKPPAIYYLNAVAIRIGGPTPWAIWVFNTVWITITFLSFYFIQGWIWSYRLSFLATLILMLTVFYPTYYIGGNFTETYALLPIILSIGFLYAYLLKGQQKFLVGLGLATAFAFLFKPTYIGVSLATILVVLILDSLRKNYRSLVKNFIIISSCILLPLILVASYWFFQNSLYEFIFAVFLHNQNYIKESFTLHSLGSTVKMYLVYQPLASVSALAGIALGGFLIENWHKIMSSNWAQKDLNLITPGKIGQENARSWLVAAIGLSTLFDFCLIAISAKNFGHYFIIAIPAMATLCAYLFHKLSTLLGFIARNGFTLATTITAILILFMFWALEVATKEMPSSYFITRFFTENVSIHKPNDLERYILDHSRADQSVLVWGLRPDLNFSTGRRSPSRFIFLSHLFSPTSKGSNGFDEFNNALTTDPPAVIVVDITSGTLPFFGAEGDNRCPDCTPDVKVGMEKFSYFVEQNYQPDGKVYDWLVFLHK